jgi:hypothetical protein
LRKIGRTCVEADRHCFDLSGAMTPISTRFL